MELKSHKNLCTFFKIWRSNRTFMELKLVKEHILKKELKVLIVPLWN